MLQRLFIFFTSLALLNGCGFHLRGMVDMPAWLDSVAIIVHEAHRELSTTLKDQLQTYNISVSADPALAKYWLIIEKDTIHQQITSVSASTTPRQYQLIYDVEFTLVSAKGPVMIPPSHIFVTRQLTVNNDRILGSDSEEITLSNEMRRDAAMQIINRISRK